MYYYRVKTTCEFQSFVEAESQSDAELLAREQILQELRVNIVEKERKFDEIFKSYEMFTIETNETYSPVKWKK